MCSNRNAAKNVAGYWSGTSRYFCKGSLNWLQLFKACAPERLDLPRYAFNLACVFAPFILDARNAHHENLCFIVSITSIVDRNHQDLRFPMSVSSAGWWWPCRWLVDERFSLQCWIENSFLSFGWQARLVKWHCPVLRSIQQQQLLTLIISPALYIRNRNHSFYEYSTSIVRTVKISYPCILPRDIFYRLNLSGLNLLAIV